MHKVGKVLGLLTAAVVTAAFALPASAASLPGKRITLAVTPTTLGPATTVVVTATISNDGNSNANSFEVDWLSSPHFTVTAASAGGTAGDCSVAATAGTGYSGCLFNKQLPTKTSVAITLTFTLSGDCIHELIDWTAFAWTGSRGTFSQAFAVFPVAPATALPVTTLVSSCGDLNCQDDTIEAEDPETGAVAIGTRLDNVDGGHCDAIPYALFWQDSEVRYLYNRGTQLIATRIHVKWPSELAPAPTNPPATFGMLGSVPLSKQEFVAPTRVNVDLCLGTPDYDGNGELVTLTPPAGGFPDLAPTLADIQYGCAYDQHITYPEPTVTEPGRRIQLEQWLYVQGDYTATRR